MSTSPPSTRVTPSVFLGILVTLAGIVGGGWGTALLMVPGIAAIPAVAIVWGFVYAVVPGRHERWPWWVAGQWLSLALVHAVSFVVTDTSYGAPTVLMAGAFALLTATLATFMWMVPVGLVMAHRQFWATKRTTPDMVGTPSEPDAMASGH
ncbi:MAG: hypothetical protein Q4P15_10050 [Propionibacteriaceae bacterium]|nr:hypothetical protein [Propionibacteriaceae bacterium]